MAKKKATDASKRAELPIPDGWKATHHAYVQVLPHVRLAPADMGVDGNWRCISQGPDSTWWLQPADDVSRHWLGIYGAAAGAVSGMVAVHRLRLVPSFLQLRLPDVAR